ncbi:MAG: hypothetical protein ACE5JN_07330 [Candidatus Methylomirabilia bacterium]
MAFLERIYRIVDTWSNLEFLSEKIRGGYLAAALSVLSYTAVQLVLIVIGLGWIALIATRERRTKLSPSHEVWVPRKLAEQVRDLQREQEADTFPIVQADHGIKRFTRGELDELSERQRAKLFDVGSEMQEWWYGKPRDQREWTRFRVPGGKWLRKEDVDAMTNETRGELFDTIPDLLDWYMEGREF